ncbi:flavin reductase family protein [Micromonospora sp. WMMA1363]|uniref:3-hydroxy-9,10-secoandrosta-1,3,5(10)-triene-9, 17-dione monooxygenase reductase subunit n=1 Tax=Micromonospora sp. WMMA1363 TaxID=3053985 RepID=UPI00259D1F0D|nr:3-hydroxy-9,10-secoandrosta-1,3,5(10)-triene-9,17-dione monooxygenase reductase subunit [Micromonospora sp. WMMA1363]MDM4719413.1 flavin reductase family protein [Micromonospora sp. WMMA1363]
MDQLRFRRVLGHFCTGVTVVTSVDGETPVGFACQSFAALSLDPPLVLFCPGRGSATWRRIARAGHFCVNILAEDQRDVSRVFGVSGADKFAGVSWVRSPGGAPIIDAVLAWVDCRIESVWSGGDHDIVIGRVTDLAIVRDARPLLFYTGRYTDAAPVSSHAPPEVVDTLLAWPRHTDWI